MMTLLKMVELILSSMDSEEINSIGDTTESNQIVDVIETTYYHLLGTIDFPDKWDFFELESFNDLSRPTLMKLPANVTKLEWVQYDYSEDGSTKREMKELFPMERKYFLERMNALDSADSNVYKYDLMVGAGTFDIRGKSDAFPSYYTTNNDRTIILDNYRKDINQTIPGNKTFCYGMILPEFIRDDNFVPQLEPRHETLLFNEAKAQAFVELKQVQNSKADERARKGWVQAHRKSPQTGRVGRQHWDYTYCFGRNVGRRR